MPSQRRLRVLLVAVVAGVILTLFYTSRLRAEQDPRGRQDFYSRTVDALDHHGGGSGGSSKGEQAVLDAKTGKGVGRTPVIDHDADGNIDEDDARLAKEMADRLKAAEQKAKDLANAKSPLKPDAPREVIGVGSSAGGQQKKVKAGDGDAAEKEDLVAAPETEEEHEAEEELNSILKQSPVIIFSKTYCPYSKRAKGLLLEKYLVEPAPYVVELDKHPMGPRLQALLARTTGRSTVPNILVSGVSIGGSDDIAEMDSNKKLVAKIKDLGNRRVDMKERFSGSS